MKAKLAALFSLQNSQNVWLADTIISRTKAQQHLLSKLRRDCFHSKKKSVVTVIRRWDHLFLN